MIRRRLLVLMEKSSEQRKRAALASAAKKRAATHCHRGHEFTPENTYWRPNDGRRRCKICQQDRNYYIRLRKRLNVITGGD
jgi:hypothetical protein